MKNKIAFIVNPISGKGKGREVEQMIRHFFKNKPFQIDTYFANYPAHAIELTKQLLTEKPDMIVACGGDGTINEVAQSMLNQSIPLGIIPIGSGNGLSSNLNIPKNITLALEGLIMNQPKMIDVGQINDRYFFSNTGFGIDAQVIHRYTAQKKRNFMGYLKATIWTFFNYKPLKYKLNFEDESVESNQYFFVLCSNSNEAGYGISFTPNAQLNDGKFDIVCVEKLNFLKMLKFGYYVITNRLNRMEEVFSKQVSALEIVSNKTPIIAQIDGEAVELNENVVKLNIIPNALPVIAPN